MLAHAYNIIIDHDVGSPVHDREFFDSLNANDKSFISMIMIYVQLPGAAAYES